MTATIEVHAIELRGQVLPIPSIVMIGGRYHLDWTLSLNHHEISSSLLIL